MKLSHSLKTFLSLIIIASFFLSCSKEEIDLPENTVAFTRAGEYIEKTETNTIGVTAFPNKLQVRGSLSNGNNLHIAVRFQDETILLNITDTTEQIYQMDNKDNGLRYFSMSDCSAYKNKPNTGTIEILEWDSKDKTCKGRFQTETTNTAGLEDGPEFLEGVFDVYIFSIGSQILDKELSVTIENKKQDISYRITNNPSNINLAQNSFIYGSFDSLNIFFPKATSEAIQTDNSKIEITLNYNNKNYRGIHASIGEINVSINNTSYRYFAFEITNLLLTQVEDPEKTVIINSACIKIPYF
ncbi:MAG: hypothetical protein ACJA1A_003529 [Saprospiraceae bacterium]|jgi:hypothetical protein